MKKINAFTLIELSMVLIIISIIVGLILTSNNLVKTAMQRNVISDLHYYNSAVKSFSEIYDALPGDISNATSYFSNTANGDNNGNIGIGDDSDPWGESILAWQHLSLSNVIDTQYYGISNGNYYQKNMNTPQTPIVPAYYSIYYFNSATGIYGKSQNAITIASMDQANNIPWANSVFTSIDAYQIDQKADDGVPYTGQIYVIRGKENYGNSSKCVTNDYTSQNSQFIFADNNVSCRILYWLK